MREDGDCDFERMDCEKNDEICVRKVEERGMKNGSDLTSLNEARDYCTAAMQLDTGVNGDCKEMRADELGFDFDKKSEKVERIFVKKEWEKEAEIGLEVLSLDEKEKKEEGLNCDFEKNGRRKRGEICEKDEGEIEPKNGCKFDLHEMSRNSGIVELGIEDNGERKGNGEDGPDCDFEKIDGEKRCEICEKKEVEKEMGNGMERESSTEALELNTEDNGKSKEKMEEGPDCNFEKQAGEKDVKNENENERDYTAKPELHIGEYEKSYEKIEEGPDCNLEKQGDEKMDEILEKKEEEKEMKNETGREFTATVELRIEDIGNIKVNLGCNSEKIDAGKREKIYEKKLEERKDREFGKKERVKMKYVVSYPQVKGRPDCPSNISNQFSSKSSCDSEETYEQEKVNNEAQLRTEWVKRDEIHEKKETDGEFEKNEGAKVKFALPYPQMKGRMDCPHYLKTGFCSYGYKCCFNHPPQIANQFIPKSSCNSEETYEQEKINNEAQLRTEWVKKDDIYEKKERDGEFEKKEGVKVKNALSYPQRKGRSDCCSFLNTGFCSYGSTCCYNHLPQFYNQFSSGSSRDYDDTYETEEINNANQFSNLPFRPGQIDCPYYMKHGSCKYSTNCRYNHPNIFITKQNPPEEYRNNEYLKHNGPLNYEQPNHFITRQKPHEDYQNNGYLENNDPHEDYQNNGYLENNDPFIYEDSNVALPCNIKSMLLPKYEGDIPPNIKAMLLPPQRPHDTEQVPVSISSSETYKGYLMESSRTNKSKSNSLERVEYQFEFPQRPGEQECAFYMKSGDCKFKSACKFHHPKDWVLKDFGRKNSRNGMKKIRLYDAIETEEHLMNLHQKGLRNHQFTDEENVKNGKIKEKKREMYPERPGKPECEYYMKHRDCKFKYTCKFHHPKDPSQQSQVFPTSD